MRLNHQTAIAAAAALGATGASGASAPFCPESQVCFRWGIPQNAATSARGTVYFQLRAPTEYRWVGLGIGSQMRGADMFVMYAAGNNNVTLSTRQGQGHTMPQYSARNDVQLMAGSGISNGQMTANVRCTGCDKLDPSGSSDWIAAWLEGSPMNSASPSERIAIHGGYDGFSVDLSKATVQSNQNPFQGGQGGAQVVGGGTTSGGGGGPSLGFAHGVVMAIIFLIGYPVGSMLMPLVGSWLLHASWQMLTFLGMWAGFGIGYVITQRANAFFVGTHVQFGVILCCLMCLQPVFGWFHHRYFVQHQQRGIVSYVHIFYGRSLMALGVINGGLGLKLAGGSGSFVTAYSVIAAIVFVAYILSAVYATFRKRRRVSTETPKLRLQSI